MALIMFYGDNGLNLKTVYRFLSCGLYSLIDNYVCIDYLSCQSKQLSSISSKPTFYQTSFNIPLGIGIPKLLLNLVSCHGFMKKPNLTVILNFLSHIVNNYLEKRFYIIEYDSKHLIMLPNDLKLRVYVIDQIETDFFMKKTQQFPL